MLDSDFTASEYSNLVVGGGHVSGVLLSTAGMCASNVITASSSFTGTLTGNINSFAGISLNSSNSSPLIAINNNGKHPQDVFFAINNATGNRLLEITNSGCVRWLGDASAATDQLVISLMTSIDKRTVTDRAREQFEIAVAQQLLLLIKSSASVEQLQAYLQDIVETRQCSQVERALTQS